MLLLQYDLMFLFSSRGNLSIWWSLLMPNKDIAGFYIIIRNDKNEILVEHHIPYESRIDNIKGADICQKNCQNLELCVMTKNSHGSINEWFDSQCIYLPNNLESIQDKYTTHNDRIYVIHSMRRKITAHNVLNHSWSKGVISSVFSTLLVYTTLFQILHFLV